MNIQMIPLNQLIPSPANVDTTGANIGIGELAASIEAHGLLQNLAVRPARKRNSKLWSVPAGSPLSISWSGGGRWPRIARSVALSSMVKPHPASRKPSFVCP